MALILELIEVLEPFYKATKKISYAGPSAICNALTSIVKLRKVMRDQSEKLKFGVTSELLNKIEQNFDNRVPVWEEMVVAAILDPNMKDTAIIIDMVPDKRPLLER